jgi:alpha-tubulin suppressor-like RCC1 family protein
MRRRGGIIDLFSRARLGRNLRLGGLVVSALLVMAAAPSQAAAPTSAGQLYAFGENFYGQLGSTVQNGESLPNPTPALVALPGATGPVTEVAAGELHSLVVTSTGQLYAFGVRA